MKIIDLDENHRQVYFLCLEDWSSEMNEAGEKKSIWFEQMKDRGLRVKLAVDDDGNACGMIQYVPVENSFINGSDLYFIYCIWIHGYKEGIGSYQKKGFGNALLHAAEEDARSMGANGIAAWGISMPFWMKASWFKKHGYKKADRDGMAVLMWKPFTQDVHAPSWKRLKKKPDSTPGKVTVTSFIHGWCPAMNLTHERARKASEEFGDRVIFQEINTLDKNVLDEWGIVDGLFIDGRQVKHGPPLSYESIRNKLNKRVKRLK